MLNFLNFCDRIDAASKRTQLQLRPVLSIFAFCSTKGLALLWEQF